MSTSQEVREEQPPEPIEVIEKFLESNRTLVTAIDKAYCLPSFEALSEAEVLILAAKDAVLPLYERRFFRDSDQDDIETAINSVMVASQEVAQQSHKVNKEHPKGITFDAEFKDQAVGSLLDEETAEVSAARLCNIYSGSVTSAHNALLTSERVVLFSMKKESHIERTKRLKNYGGMAMAVFAATYLANKLQRRN
jgi:hypothetical protein